MEPLIVLFIIMAISSLLKKRGQQNRKPPGDIKRVTEDPPQTPPPFPEKERLVLEFEEKRKQEANKTQPIHQLREEGTEKRTSTRKKKNKEGEAIRPAEVSSLFSTPGSLKQGIIMAEVLGPPKAIKNRIR